MAWDFQKPGSGHGCVGLITPTKAKFSSKGGSLHQCLRLAIGWPFQGAAPCLGLLVCAFACSSFCNEHSSLEV